MDWGMSGIEGFMPEIGWPGICDIIEWSWGFGWGGPG
jgi:hypothetical protein